jgi:hypothetical protein
VLEPLVPAQAGTQLFACGPWIPACAGMSGARGIVSGYIKKRGREGPVLFRDAGAGQAGPCRLTFLSGNDLARTPVAANTAFATDGAVAAVPGSPMPPHFLPPESAR